MKLKYLLALICMLPFITACNNEDDVNAIFCSGTWTLLNFYETTDWEGQTPKNTRTTYNPSINPTDAAKIQELQKFTILFKQDGSFTAIANSSTLSGTWSADGKNRYITIGYQSQPTGSTMAKPFFETLKNAKYYRGTGGANGFLQLAPEGKNTFIQFKHE